MKYKVSVVKRITLLLMTMALAVVFLACQAATPKAGDPGPAGPAGEPAPQRPYVDKEFEDVRLMTSGDDTSKDITLAGHFVDPDGDDSDLTYDAVSDQPDVVTAEVSGSTLTITAVAVGEAKITVKAMDEDGQASSGAEPGARFTVTVVETGAPEKTKDIPDQELYEEDAAKEITLSEYFTHDGDIIYTPSTSVAGIVIATVEGATLTLDPQIAGSTVVTVTAMADSKSITDEFTVRVREGSRPTPPAPTEPDPPMKEGTIMAQSVEAGKSTDPMDVSGYFTPATGLTYTAASSDEAKATATIPTGSSMLTITGVAGGPATVTVTATNSAGMATQTIAVTVTAAGPTHIEDLDYMVEIEGVGDEVNTKKIRIDEGQRLQPLEQARSYVTVAREKDSTTVWVFTGKKKTPTDAPAKVRIWNEDGTRDMDISVTVKNTSPKSKDNYPSVVIPTTDGTTNVHVYVDDKKKVTPATSGIQADEHHDGHEDDVGRLYHKARFNFSDYFEDADNDIASKADDNGYRARSNVQDEVKVVKVLPDGVVIDVKRDTGPSFPLVVYAVDESGAPSNEITLTVNSPMPLGDRYEVPQDRADGDFGVAKVYQREGVPHTLTFANFGDSPDGFRFVDVLDAELTAAQTPPLAGTAALVEPADAAAREALITAGEGSYYSLSKTGSIKLVADADATPPHKGLTLPGEVPTLMFEVTGSGQATVTITYFVVVDADTDTAAGATDYEWRDDFELLTMNIVPSS